MRALVLSMTCVLLMMCAAPAAGAHAAPAAGALVELRVVDRDSGRALPLHWHRGQAWIAGTPGHRYAVVLSNRTGRRLLAVLSVDGINAVTGETASGGQAGYVLAPWGRTEVTGWRKSLDQVAAFEFTALGDSYAARTGRPAHVGVIGVAVFEERARQRHHEDEIARAAPHDGRGHAKADAGAAPLAESAGPASDAIGPRAQARAPAPAGEPLGTGHGAREWSVARHTRFERARGGPAELVTLRYDSLANLAAAGIVPSPWHGPGRRHPQPFPGGFVPDP